MCEREIYRGAAVAEMACRVTGILPFMAALLPQLQTGQAKAWLDAEAHAVQVVRAPVVGERPSLTTWPRHHVVQCGGSWHCRICQAVARTPGGALRLRAAPCRGHTASHMPMDLGTEWAVSRGHQLMATGPWAWCFVCGAHTSSRYRMLKRPCRGHMFQRQISDRLAASRGPLGEALPAGGNARRLRASEASSWDLA